MGSVGDPETAQEIAALGRLLAHPVRVRILATLDGGTASAAQLAPGLGVSVSAVAYHLKLLADGGALRLVRTVRVRGTLQQIWQRAPELDGRLRRLCALLEP